MQMHGNNSWTCLRITSKKCWSANCLVLQKLLKTFYLAEKNFKQNYLWYGALHTVDPHWTTTFCPTVFQARNAVPIPAFINPNHLTHPQQVTVKTAAAVFGAQVLWLRQGFGTWYLIKKPAFSVWQSAKLTFACIYQDATTFNIGSQRSNFIFKLSELWWISAL